MAPHAFAASPEKKLSDYRPGQSDKELRYRILAYKPKTYLEFGKATGAVRRIFSDAVTGIDYPETPPIIQDDDDHPKTYFEGMFYDEKSVLHYTSTVALPFMLGDANSVLTLERKPQKEGENAPYELIPILYGAADVLDCKPGGYFLLYTDQKSQVKIGTQEVWEGNVMYYFNRFTCWTIYQYGEMGLNLYKAKERMSQRHEDGQVMCRILGGVGVSYGRTNFYNSFFAPAVPAWDTALCQESDYRVCIGRAAFPQRVLAYTTCGECGGQKPQMDTCGSCQGTGKIGGNVSNPFTDIEIRRDKRDPDALKPAELVYVVPEDTTYLEFLKSDIQSENDKAMAALHLTAMEGVNELNSGRAKEIDRSDLNEFLKTIAAQAYDLIEFIYKGGMILRYGDFSGVNPLDLVPDIERPIDYSVATVDTLIEESKRAKEAGLSVSYIKQVDKLIAIRQYGQDSEASLRICAAIAHDPYYGKSADELMGADAVAPGTVDALHYFISINIDRIISMAIARNGDFLYLPEQVQDDEIQRIANVLRGDTIDVDDPEAASKAKIRGSVGGVQALIAMNAAVARGEMSPEAAEAVLMQIYGIEADAARAMIDLPPKSPFVPPAIEPVV